MTPVFAGEELGSDVPFSFDALTEAMRASAARPWVAPASALPAFLTGLDYDGYRLIEPRGDRAVALGPGLGYHLQPFHLGWLYTEPVRLFETDAGRSTALAFTSADFDYRRPALAAAAAAEPLPGVAGFRLSYPLNRDGELSELISFVGASYFRALGRANVYGASARGVAVNSWVTEPEEFPHFSSFYLERTAPGQPLVACATLEGPSLTGAYRFSIAPGGATTQETVIDVTARLFFRTNVTEVGIAPLTSMFLFAEANRSRFDDYRPQVHDSNGLFVQRRNGETLWRALNNPPRVANSYISEASPRAFGLMQRDRSFGVYQDAGARYELRPSVLVEPVGEWGPGAIRLIEIPAKLEADDNVVAFWVPQAPFKAGDSAEYAYRMRWGNLAPDPAGDVAYVAETRAGQGGVSGVANAQSLRKFVVDFAGGPLARADAPAQLDVVATVGGGRIVYATASALPENGLTRLVIDAEIDTTDPVELRAYLVGGGRQLTETWLYQWHSA